MRTKWLLLFVISLSLVLTSCYKQQETATLEEYDITFTNYDTEFDFNTYNTFFVRDSVMLYSDYLKDEEIEEFYTDGTSDEIRSVIINKFKSLGYTEGTDMESSDFLINPSILMNTQTSVTYYPYYWWGYPGYWGWYGGYWKNTNVEKGTDYYPYYGWYPSWGATYYSYNTGSMVMDMADGKSVMDYFTWLENAGPNPDPNEAPAVEFRWTAKIDGILGDDASYNGSRAVRGFNEAFEQSPYLQK